MFFQHHSIWPWFYGGLLWLERISAPRLEDNILSRTAVTRAVKNFCCCSESFIWRKHKSIHRRKLFKALMSLDETYLETFDFSSSWLKPIWCQKEVCSVVNFRTIKYIGKNEAKTGKQKIKEEGAVGQQRLLKRPVPIPFEINNCSGSPQITLSLSQPSSRGNRLSYLGIRDDYWKMWCSERSQILKNAQGLQRLPFERFGCL